MQKKSWDFRFFELIVGISPLIQAVFKRIYYISGISPPIIVKG